VKYLVNIYLAFYVTSCIILSNSCNQVKQNKQMKIYHLKPNRLIVNDETNTKDNWFKQEREDFFTIENFNIEIEEHKAEIDSFVLNYIKKENFLAAKNNVNWSLVFFKYGDGITENTAHQYDTDYDMHQLFAFKKRLIYYYFTSENGYENTGYYLNGDEVIKNEKRVTLQSLVR